MSFAHPWVLLSGILPVALLWWVWRRDERRVVLPFDHAANRSGVGWRALIHLAESLPAILLAVVIVLLAGPRQFSEPKTKRVATNIEFCVDISGSMTASFGDGSRYDGSLEAINQFLDYRKGDAFGLTFFGNSVLHWTPLTTDASALRCAPPFMRPESVPSWFGGTEIGKALLACRKVLGEREEGDRMIVLVTDGFSSDLSGGSDTTIAKRLRDANITVFPIVVGRGINDQMVNLASLTGGEAFEAGDPESLEAIFRRIDAMQRTRLEATVAESMDHFGPWCVAALTFLSMATLTLFGLRHTPW